eukprot:Skav210848  [mRNA]  locus=scaffold2829:110063:110734:- [translate_table: standard]
MCRTSAYFALICRWSSTYDKDKKGEQPAKIRLYSIASSAVGDDQTSKTGFQGVKRVVELDGKFSNRAKGEDKPDKAGTAFPDNEVYRGVCSNHICEAWRIFFTKELAEYAKK